MTSSSQNKNSECLTAGRDGMFASDSYSRARIEDDRARKVTPTPITQEEICNFADLHLNTTPTPAGMHWRTSLGNNYGHLFMADRFAKAVVKSGKPIYDSADRSPSLGRHIQAIVPNHQWFAHFLSVYRPDIRFSEQLQLAFDSAKDLELLWMRGWVKPAVNADYSAAQVLNPYIPAIFDRPGTSCVDPKMTQAQLLNKWAASIQTRAKTIKYSNTLKSRGQTARSNLASARMLLREVFEWRACIRIECLQLGYLPEHSAYVTAQHAKENVIHLLRNVRTNMGLFEGLGAYIWTLDKGPTGWYVRLWLFYDATVAGRSPELAFRIEAYWSVGITNGTGQSNNCSFDSRPAFALALGDVHQTDEMARNALDRLLQLIAWKHTVIAARVPGRAFQTSVSPAVDDRPVARKR